MSITSIIAIFFALIFGVMLGMVLMAALAISKETQNE